MRQKASNDIAQCLSALVGSLIMKSTVASACALNNATTSASGASRMGSTFAASFKKARDAGECAMPGLATLRGDIIRYNELRERSALLGKGCSPVRQMRPHVLRLFADAASGRQSV